MNVPGTRLLAYAETKVPAGVDGLRDERALMGVVAGVLWISMGALLLVIQLLPGTPHEHETFVLAATPGLIVYGVLCVRLIIPWTTTSMGLTALVSAVLFPVVGVALWATGGAGSYMELMLFPAVLFSAWFQRPLYAWLLNGELVLIVGVSLLYDPDAIAEAQPARVDVRGVSVSPRDVVAAVLPDPALLGDHMTGRTCAGTMVSGTGKDGRPRATYLHHIVDNERTMREDGCQAVVWQTAINPVIAMELLAEGVWSGAGVLGPEALPPAPFLDRLADYGAPHGVDERVPAA